MAEAPLDSTVIGPDAGHRSCEWMPKGRKNRVNPHAGWQISLAALPTSAGRDSLFERDLVAGFLFAKYLLNYLAYSPRCRLNLDDPVVTS